MLLLLGLGFAVNTLLLTSPLYMLQIYDRVLTSRSEETLVVRFNNIFMHSMQPAIISVWFKNSYRRLGMARKSKRASLHLTEKQSAMLSNLAHSRTGLVREVERAKILLEYAQGASIADIERRVGVSRPTVYWLIPS
uniref:Homeodomain-like domain-containing protein n=1 Tax=Candidatus Kentrum sp. UNK TaxID=2126344 RepID=A0A451ANP4_9GAMM|nr:MAG: Homeodomain-like domain-containing protein [Candidatus Kentron sp. UNK]